MFVNRIKEIERLTKALKRSDTQLIIVWGRRRCGKTALLQHILKKDIIYFTADLREGTLQKEALAIEAAKELNGFDQVLYPDWEALLLSMNRALRKRITLCLDEFPYLVKNNPELPSVIQKLIDQHKLNNLNLILCGSSQQMMRSTALDSNSPLYGRSTEILRINPMGIQRFSNFLELEPINAVREYGVWGGIPRYWEIRKSTSKFEEAVKYHILDQHGILFEEPERLFADEMRTSVQTWSVLSIIAGGSHRISEIAGRLGKPATQLSRLLAFLVDLGYIRREIPFGELAKSSKKSLYKINDPFLNFYFSFVLPNKSMLELGMAEQVWKQISSKYEQYISFFWEELCRQTLPFLSIDHGPFMPASRWWGTGNQEKPIELDLVAASIDNKSLIIAEIKWSDKDRIREIESSLDQKIQQLTFINRKRIIKAAFVKRKPLNYKGEMILFDPADIVQASI